MAILVNNETYYRTTDVCRIVGISRNTLFRWTKTGRFGEETRDWRGWRLFTQSQLEQLKAITGADKLIVMSNNLRDTGISRASGR
jgi:predicted site-specific integrase-resolvase